jgi:hypothetical protein
MEDLIYSMTHDNPVRRPQIEEVVEKFTHIRRSLSMAKLRSAIISRKASKFRKVIKRARHSVSMTRYMVSGLPAIPDPYESVKTRKWVWVKHGRGRLLRKFITGSRSSVASLGRTL